MTDTLSVNTRPNAGQDALRPLSRDVAVKGVAAELHEYSGRLVLRKVGHVPSQSKIGLLVNQGAGSFKRLGRARLEGKLHDANLRQKTEIVYCDGSELATHARKLATQGIDAIAVYGGDGSAHSVVAAIRGLDIPILPLPGGTLNRLCHRVHGHARLDDILARVAQAQTQWLSGGKANDHVFLVAAGFGPLMGLEKVREVARKSGLVAGSKALLKGRHNYFDHQLSLDGGVSDVDVIIAAPGFIDQSFGFGDGNVGLLANRLEVAAARLNGPVSSALLGAHVFTQSWRDLAHVHIMTAPDGGIEIVSNAGSENTNNEICGLVDGEMRFMGDRIHLSFNRHSALVLSTR